MFKENSDAPPAVSAESEEMVVTTPAPKLSQEEIVEFTSKWNLMVAYTLLDIVGFEFNIENVRKKMAISADEASVVIETLDGMGLLAQSANGNYSAKPLYFDQEDISSSDTLNNTLKVKRQAIERLTSKEFFGFQFDVLSKKIIAKHFHELYALMAKMAEESRGQDDCEVYSFDFSFAKATETRKVK